MGGAVRRKAERAVSNQVLSSALWRAEQRVGPRRTIAVMEVLSRYYNPDISRFESCSRPNHLASVNLY
ncbi:hypothetical protein TNCV_1180771 [Trichonephila clavipes]|nr:hypothetical protein TNCV_1180771 [Trichonephila clavipes]